MRILIVTPFLPYPAASAGGVLVMYRLLLELASRHEVTLATFVASDDEKRGSDDLRRAGIDVHCAARPMRGVVAWLRRAMLAARWPFSASPLRALAFCRPSMQRLIDRLVSETQFDLIQVEDSAMAAYRYPAHLPRVLTEHEVRSPQPEGRARTTDPIAWVRGLDTLRWRSFQPRAWRGCERIQVFTRQDSEVLAALAPELASRTRVNPFGVDAAVSNWAQEEMPDSLLFIGGFDHPPNVDAALWLVRQIFPRVLALRPAARLTIVGRDPPRSLRQLAGKRVEITGFVDNVEPFVRRAAVIVAPIRTGGGMRVKVVQAMAMGKAIVATPRAAEGIEGPDSDLPLLVASSEEEFAAATAELLGSADARQALGVRAREFATAHLSWSQFGERLESIYAELLPTSRCSE